MLPETIRVNDKTLELTEDRTRYVQTSPPCLVSARMVLTPSWVVEMERQSGKPDFQWTGEQRGRFYSDHYNLAQ